MVNADTPLSTSDHSPVKFELVFDSKRCCIVRVVLRVLSLSQMSNKNGIKVTTMLSANIWKTLIGCFLYSVIHQLYLCGMLLPAYYMLL